MNVNLTQRAREKGIQKIKILEQHETEDFIAAIMFEKRIKNKESIEWLDPVVIFKHEFKHADYDQIIKLADESGLVILLPDIKNFRNDYYGLSFNGYSTIIKSWGYTSNHLPLSRRWDKSTIEENAKKWLPDIILVSETINYLFYLIKNIEDYKERVSLAHQWFNEKHIA